MKKFHLLLLTLGVFSIINTELGVVGILPAVAQRYQVGLPTASLLVSLFALAIAISGPTLPLMLSGVNRKWVMLPVLSVFLVCNIVSAFSPSFGVTLVARVIPAFFHPFYVSMAFSVAVASVRAEESPKAVSKVMIGVSAGMVVGVPVSSYIASTTSLRMAMLYFAAVNALALLATILLMPSLPVREKRTYGSQLGILSRHDTWISIIGVILLNGAIYGVYSYISEYLERVTSLSGGLISIFLLIYGLANIVGNAVAGRLLVWRAYRFVATFPILLAAVYAALYFAGQFTLPAAIVIGLWGILAGAGANINQYWITSAAPDAPDFANGLFIATANVGTTIGTTVGAFLISGLGIKYFMTHGLVFLALALATISMRIRLSQSSEDFAS